MQKIIRKGSFDAGHRVMNEAMKCFNLHGHTYLYELVFKFDNMQEIGYAIDFKEIKRVGAQWIDDRLDHGMLLNPKDVQVASLVQELGNKLWLMSLNGWDYCNPTVENIAREILLAMDILFSGYKGLKIHKIKLWETPNCCTTVKFMDIPQQERCAFNRARRGEIAEYALEKGIVEYDDRKQ